MAKGRTKPAWSVPASTLVREPVGRRVHQCVAELQNALSWDVVGAKSLRAVTGKLHGVQTYWRLLKAKTTLQEVYDS